MPLDRLLIYNILLRSISNTTIKLKFFVQLSINSHWYLGDNSLVHELRVMAAVDLHVNATYYAQHPALKLVYVKSQPVIGGKLFSLYCMGKCLN